MRSAGAGLFGALLMVAPLVAIPVLAVVGVPQFAPAVSRTVEGAGDTEIGPLDEGDAAGSPARSSRKAATRRRHADDLYAPLAEPLGDGSAAEDSTSQESDALPDPDSIVSEEPQLPALSSGRPGNTRRESPAESRLWSNTSPRGSLGDWEVEADRASSAATRGGRSRSGIRTASVADLSDAVMPADEGPGRTGSGPADSDSGPITEAGTINFLARDKAPAGAATRAAPAPPTRRAPARAGARPIPMEESQGEVSPISETRASGAPRYRGQVADRGAGARAPAETLDDDTLTSSDASLGEAAPAAGRAGKSRSGASARGELGAATSSDDEDEDVLSEAELERGFSGDPLRSGSVQKRSATRPGASAAALAFPEPSAADFEDSMPLSGKKSDDSPDALGGEPSGEEQEPAAGEAVIDDPALESLTWTQATAQLKKWGIRKYRLEADAQSEGFVFVCMAPDPNSPKVNVRFETYGADPLAAVRKAIGEISAWYAGRTRSR